MLVPCSTRPPDISPVRASRLGEEFGPSGADEIEHLGEPSVGEAHDGIRGAVVDRDAVSRSVDEGSAGEDDVREREDAVGIRENPQCQSGIAMIGREFRTWASSTSRWSPAGRGRGGGWAHA